VPRAGDRVDYRGFEIEVLDAERKRVNRVRPAGGSKHPRSPLPDARRFRHRGRPPNVGKSTLVNR
jgi:hypothetical protein